MRIMIIPPHNSALDLYFIPKRLPILTPAAEQTKVTIPMKETAGTIATLRNANVTPTASASILVATASKNMDLTSRVSPDSTTFM